MKVSSKFFRCSFVIMLALIVAFSAAIGVSADEMQLSAKLLLANDQASYFDPGTSLNINTSVVTDNCKLGFYIDNTIQKNYTYAYTCTIQIIQRTGLFNVSTTPYQSQLYNQVLSYIENNVNSNIPTSVTIDSKAINGGYYNITCTALINAEEFPDLTDYQYYYMSLPFQNNENSMISYVDINAYAIYDPGQSEFDIIVDKLDSISSNQDEINQNLTTIIQNQVIQNNNWQILLNYGSNYNQIDSNLIGSLGTAEDQLSSAEDALENKSNSLKDSVSSQWSTIQSNSKTFITNIAPAAAAVGTVTTQLMNSAPEEVKSLFVIIPLLIFIGWLIGRVRGD